MASLRDIRNRIKSAKNSEKITKAMKVVSAAKLKRAQEAARQSKSFAKKLDEVIAHLAKRAQSMEGAAHPLLSDRLVKHRVEIIVLTSDRGLCGAFNSNVIKHAKRLLAELTPHCQEIRIVTLGKRGYEAFHRANLPIRANYEDILNRPKFQKASEIAAEICDSYIKDTVDAVWLVYNEFKSALSQRVVCHQMLPVIPVDIVDETTPVDFIYEPDQRILMNQLLPQHFATQLYQAFLESVASEHGARMTAMDNATRNAKEMISSLTLKYNRARQASITRELMEIIGGAEALKG